jgi:hypothetical protein
VSVTYSLHRLKQPLAERPLTTATCAASDFLPFGSLDDIARRLVAALEPLGPVRREDQAGGPWVNPFSRRAVSSMSFRGRSSVCSTRSRFRGRPRRRSR